MCIFSHKHLHLSGFDQSRNYKKKSFLFLQAFLILQYRTVQTSGNVDYLRIEKPNQKNFHENQLLLHIGYVAMHYERWKLDNDSKYAKFGLVWDYKCIQITYRKLFAPRTQQIAERSQNKICAEINCFLMKEIKYKDPRKYIALLGNINDSIRHPTFATNLTRLRFLEWKLEIWLEAGDGTLW